MSAVVRQTGAEVYRESFLRGIAPDPPITVSEWAEANRILSPISSNQAGPYRVAETPFWREPMDALSSGSPVERVSIMKGAQVGATELGNNWLGYVIDVSPGPAMLVAPVELLAKKMSRQRLDPMFADCPRLRDKVSVGKTRDGASSVLMKSFPGGMLSLVGANAPSGFRSMPARYLMRDEVDAYPVDVGDEGDPLILSERATATFSSNRKLLDISTPTIEGRSRIQVEFERGDRRYFHLPCPHCGTLQRLVWKPPKDPAPVISIEFDSELEPEDAGASAVGRCGADGCGKTIEESSKRTMLAAGVWIAEKPERSSFHRSYHLSALYSPWRSWAEIVARFLKAKGKPTELRTWTNHDLGECWAEKGEAPDWELLYRRREKYVVGTIPARGVVLTAGVDVQKDRLEVEVVAWGAPRPGENSGESWSVDYLVLPGSPTESDVWRDLSDMLARSFLHQGGSPIRISRVAVDSGGHWTQDVYRWGRKQSARQVMIIKGSDRVSTVLQAPKVVDVMVKGRRLRQGVKLWTIGVSILKEDLYGRLHIEPPLEEGDPFPGGFCHFPEYPESYFRSLTAEVLVPRIVKGYRVYQWELPHGTRNEALDCRVYAMAAAESLGLSRWTPDRWAKIAAEVGSPLEEGEGPAPAPAKRRKGRRRGSAKGFDRWRDSP